MLTRRVMRKNAAEHNTMVMRKNAAEHNTMVAPVAVPQ